MKTEPQIMTAADLLNYRDPDAKGITIEAGWITLNWRYPYDIELSRIPDHPALLRWVNHLCEKGWMDGHRISLFIEAVARHKGWSLHGLA
jgi:hypothetical protein